MYVYACVRLQIQVTRAQLSQRKPTVAFVCYWQTDDIHTFCDLGYLKLIVAVCAKRGKIMGTVLNTKGVQLVPRSVTLSKRLGSMLPLRLGL